MQRTTLLQIFILTCFYLLSIVYGLKCFQCNSYDDAECFSLKNNDTNSPHFKDCPANTTFCRKIYQKIQNKEQTERVRRSCGWIVYKDPKDYCWRADTDFKKERICQCFGDACNTSSRNGSLFAGFFIAAILFLVYV